MIAHADAHPLRSDSGRTVPQNSLIVGLAYPLNNKEAGWPALRDAVKQATAGDGTRLLSFADLAADRRTDGTYASNRNQVAFAVNCLDRPDHSTVAQIRAAAVALGRQSPIFGAFVAWAGLPCTIWPATSTVTPAPIHASGAAPILVVGTTRDPATPYQQAVALTAQLASGRLLTKDGDGHTAYLTGSSCIDGAVNAYLLKGTLPPDRQTCH
jgi:hypothetical protein